MSNNYDLVVVGSGFAGSMTALNFLEQCKKDGKQGRVAIIELGKNGERCGASRWTMAYLRIDKDNNFDSDWVKEMELVSRGSQTLTTTANSRHSQHHDEKNVLLEFNTNQHFVFPEGGGNAIITALFKHIATFPNCDIHWEAEATMLITSERGEITGVKVRKSDGLLYDMLAPNVMLACGGFEGNREMLARYVGHNTHVLPLIAPGLKYNRGIGLNMALEVGAGTAGSFDGMHLELVDT